VPRTRRGSNGYDKRDKYSSELLQVKCIGIKVRAEGIISHVHSQNVAPSPLMGRWPFDNTDKRDDLSIFNGKDANQVSRIYVKYIIPASEELYSVAW
jgi:hypothetical protein